MSIADRRPRARLHAARTPTAPTTRSATAGADRRRRSPATTAPTRWPGTTGCWTSRATTPAGRALPVREPQRRRALPGRLARRDEGARPGRRRLAGPVPARRVAGGGPRLRRADHAGRLRRRRARARCATAAPRTPTTATRRRTPPGSREALDARARGARSRADRDGAGRLQRQVEAVTPPRRGLLAVALGLASSVAWGISDFLGGLKSRSLHLLTVLLISQAMGLLPLVAIVALRGEPLPAGAEPALGALGGLAGLIGLAASTAASRSARWRWSRRSRPGGHDPGGRRAWPRGDRPSALQVVGVVVALTGVVLASRERARRRARPPAWPPASGSRCCPRSASAASSSASTRAARTTSGGRSLFVRGASLERARARGARRCGRRSRCRARPTCAALVAIGVLDVTANGLFAAAANEGLVSVVAVLGSLYPVVTILLARWCSTSGCSAIQQVGVAAALCGVAFISAPARSAPRRAGARARAASCRRRGGGSRSCPPPRRPSQFSRRSSTNTHSSGGTPIRSAPSRKISGCGLCMPTSAEITTPSNSSGNCERS